MSFRSPFFHEPRAHVLLLTLLAGCGDAAKTAVRARPPVAVLVAPVQHADVPYTIEANGVVTPMASVAITSQVDGIVQHVGFREGQEVSRGQELFTIDQRPYQAVYDQTRAALARDRATAENTRAIYERYRTMPKGEVVTGEQVEQYRATAASTAATVQLDSAAMQTAKFNLDNTVIRAPISGRTGSVLVLPGNQVRSGGATPLLVIHQTHPIYVRFSVPAAELRSVLRYSAKGGLPVVASPSGAAAPGAADSTARRPRSADGLSRAPVPAAQPLAAEFSRGTLSFVDNAVDTTTGTVMLKASFPNTDGMLWVGQFVSTTLQLYVEPGAMVVPTPSVVTGQRGTYVYVIDDSLKDSLKVRQRPVTVARTAGQLSIISSGLSAGERVVTDGQSRLTPGAPVEIRTGMEKGSGGKRGKGSPPGGGGRKEGVVSDSSAKPGSMSPGARTTPDAGGGDGAPKREGGRGGGRKPGPA